MSTTSYAAIVRYEVQTRSGLDWGHYAASADLERARQIRASCKRTGYRARIFDRLSKVVIK